MSGSEHADVGKRASILKLAGCLVCNLVGVELLLLVCGGEFGGKGIDLEWCKLLRHPQDNIGKLP